LSRKNQFGVPMIAFGITASLALAFPLALRFDNVNLTLVALARDRTGDRAAVRRNPFTDKVLPVAAVTISVALAVSFDYRTIFLRANGDANYFSITLTVLTFIAVPAIAYVHYYRTADR
jgi:hypothetical protein